MASTPGNVVLKRQRYGKCWCGRPINRPDSIECAEHDDPPDFGPIPPAGAPAPTA